MKARIVTAAAVLLLAACEGGEHSDLRAELDRLTRDLPRRVDALPQVKPYEPVPYEAFDIADPFGPAKIELATRSAGTGGGSGVAPDLNRPKEPLEAYPLETLKMVGTLIREKQNFALVKADSGLYRVRIGNYMGQNFG